MVTTKLVTINDLIEMGSDAPYELIEGELSEMSPAFANSSFVTGRLTILIGQFVLDHDLGWIASAEGGFVLRRDPDTLVAPDIGFIRNDRLPPNYDFESFVPAPPDFAVEVVSSSDRSAEIMRKLSLYISAGVPLIWIVYPRQRAVTVYEAGEPPTTFRAGDELNGGSVLPGLRIAVNAIFAKMMNT